jgi:hypothetical protein
LCSISFSNPSTSNFLCVIDWQQHILDDGTDELTKQIVFIEVKLFMGGS